MKSLLIRTDANTQIGIGHMMRCLALGQTWQDAGGKAAFVVAIESSVTEDQLRSEGIEVFKISAQPGSTEDAVKTHDLAEEMRADYMVLDGYHFDSAYQQKTKEAGCRLMVIDDMALLHHYYSDFLLNQNTYAKNLKYSCEPYTKLLLGTKYVLLRRGFLKWRRWKREIPEVARKILVTLGGGDPENVTLKVIQALKGVNVNNIEVAIVIGPTNTHLEIIKNELSHVSFSYRLLSSVRDIPELMAWADIAVSAGGSTCWELAFIGLPNAILFFAENQRGVAEHLHRKGVALNLGPSKSIRVNKITDTLKTIIFEKELREKMSERGQELVDGEGAERVFMYLSGQKIRLRRVHKEDCKLLWNWASDPEVRATAFSADPIPWEEHVKWFMRKLQAPNCLSLIALDDEDIPVGQVRFDMRDDQEAEIDVSIDKSKRGLGYGSLLISMAVEEVFRITPIKTVHAFIKPHNDVSIRAFENGKFKRLGIETLRQNISIHYTRSKSDGQ